MNPFSASPITNKITFQLGNIHKKCVFDPQKQNQQGRQPLSNSAIAQSHSYIEDQSFISRQMQFTLQSYYTSIGYDKKPNVAIQDYKYQFKPYQTFSQIIYQPSATQNLNTKYKKVMFVKQHKIHYNRVRSERHLFFRKIQDLIYFILGKMKLGPYQNIQSQQLYTLFCCRKTKPQVNIPSFLQNIQYTNRLAYISYLIQKKQAQFQIFQADQFERMKKLIENQIFQIQTMYHWCFQEIHFLGQCFEEIKALNRQFCQIQNQILNLNFKPTQTLIGLIQQPKICQQFQDNIVYESIGQEEKENKKYPEELQPSHSIHQIVSEQEEVFVQINDQSDSSIVNIPKKTFKKSLLSQQNFQQNFQDIKEVQKQQKSNLSNKWYDQESIQNKIVSVKVIENKIFLQMGKKASLIQDFKLQASRNSAVLQIKDSVFQIAQNTGQQLQLQRIMKIDRKYNNQQYIYHNNRSQVAKQLQFLPKNLINTIQREEKQTIIMNFKQLYQENRTDKALQEGEVIQTEQYIQTEQQIQPQRFHRNQGFFFPPQAKKFDEDDFEY